MEGIHENAVNRQGALAQMQPSLTEGHGALAQTTVAYRLAALEMLRTNGLGLSDLPDALDHASRVALSTAYKALAFSSQRATSGK